MTQMNADVVGQASSLSIGVFGLEGMMARVGIAHRTGGTPVPLPESRTAPAKEANGVGRLLRIGERERAGRKSKEALNKGRFENCAT